MACDTFNQKWMRIASLSRLLSLYLRVYVTGDGRPNERCTPGCAMTASKAQWLQLTKEKPGRQRR